MEDITNYQTMNHKINLTNRNHALLTGIEDVISFDVNTIILKSVQGMMTIKGEELHIKRLHLEKGEVDIDGMIESLVYMDNSITKGKKTNFVGRLFS